MTSGKTQINILQQDPLKVSATKNKRPVSRAVALRCLEKHYGAGVLWQVSATPKANLFTRIEGVDVPVSVEVKNS